MKGFSVAFVLLLAAPMVFAAPVPKELRKDPLVGIWKIESVMTGERPGTAVGDHWTIEPNGDLLAHNGPKLPPGGIAPNRLIFDHAERSVDFLQHSDKRNFPGTYVLNGDTLTISFNMVDQIRPKKVEAAHGVNYWTLTRVKMESAK